MYIKHKSKKYLGGSGSTDSMLRPQQQGNLKYTNGPKPALRLGIVYNQHTHKSNKVYIIQCIDKTKQ